MKRIITVIFLILIALSLFGCNHVKYNESDFIGKTSSEIQAQFGPFDCVMMPADTDGLYRNSSCGYTIREPRVGYLGTDPEILFFITFDENGVAFCCYEGYRPGG